LKQFLLKFLVCPYCKVAFKIEILTQSKDEIEAGTLRCTKCSRNYRIIFSIPSLMPDEYYSNLKKNGVFADWFNKEDRSQVKIRDKDALFFRKRYESGEFVRRKGIPILEPRNIMIKKDIEDEKINKALIINHDSLVLDIGAGYGRFPLLLADQVKEAFAADFSFECLRLGHEIARSIEVDNIHFIHCDARLLPFASGMADAIISQEVISHIPRTGRVESAVDTGRCLKTKGKFLLTAGNYNLFLRSNNNKECAEVGKLYYVKYTVNELTEILESAFKVKRIRGLDCVPRRFWRMSSLLAKIMEWIIQRSRFLSSQLGVLLFAECEKGGIKNENSHCQTKFQ